MSKDNGVERLDIIAVTTADGKYYLTERKTLDGTWNSSGLDRLLFDGAVPLPTFEKQWVCVKAKPKRIIKMVKQPHINYRYELQDKSMISDKLPEFMPRESVAMYDPENYAWDWNDDMKQYKSLYIEIHDEQPDIEERCEFTLEIVATTSKVVDPVEMSYETSKGNKLSDKAVKYQLADRVLFPSILLPQRPAKLSSEASYKIVRRYIQANIDPGVATITSDYDFCFTVKRRVFLAKILKYTVDVNNSIFQKRKRKPKYVKKEEKERLDECFEMTHASQNYKGYTPIQGFQANTQKELKAKIDAYCREVIEFINKKIVECPHCEGGGVVMSEPERDKE